MAKKILVAYDTMFGSTAEIAEFIAKELGKGGDVVEVCRASDVTDVNGYQAVVVVGPIRGSKWIPGALGFLEKHQEALGQRPMALFTA